MAKKQMMDPKTMKGAEMSMMGEKSALPSMVAQEMMQMEALHDKGVMRSMEQSAIAKNPDGKMMADPKKTQMAMEKMAADPQAMTMLFQELVARHIASKKMSMMMKAAPQMETMEGKKMKSMMMDSKAMMMAEQKMSADDHAMMMARESLAESLMHDADLMSLVEKQAMMHMDDKMAPMMDAKVKSAQAAMMKDEGQMQRMMQGTMIRSSAMMQKNPKDGKTSK